MSSTLQLIAMIFIWAWGHSQGITMYGMKYTKSFVNLEPNEVQLDSNDSEFRVETISVVFEPNRFHIEFK